MLRSYLLLTSEYVKNTYLKTQPKEVARLLSLEHVFDWDVITEMDLSFLKIAHIAGLGLVSNLIKLRLAQNHIHKIENLQWLTKLEHLDLSFNKITKIENLEKLTAMRYLNLRHNRVSVLENMDDNTQLQTFIVSDNAIADVEQIFYMKRFKRLRYLDVSKNSAIRKTRHIIIDQLPTLRYLNNKRILNEERSRVQASEDELEDTRRPRHSDVKPSNFLTAIDGLQFLHYLYRDDWAGKLLNKWNSTVRSAYNVYTTDMNEHAMNLYHTVLSKIKVRDEISRTFKGKYYKMERNWTEKSRVMIREFEEIRKIRMSTLSGHLQETDSGHVLANDSEDRSLSEPYSIDVLLSCLESGIDSLIDRLLITNFKMNRSIVMIINTYEHILHDEMKLFMDALVPIFFNLREVENVYSQVLTENVKLVVNNTHKIIPNMFLSKFENRYAIVQVAFQITDKHLDMINKREEKFNSDANNWTKNTIDELRKTEKKRNWMVIQEVGKYHETFLAWIQTLKL